MELTVEEIVNNQVIIESGVDFESRPILAIFGCKLPNPQKYDYDTILKLIFQKLDLFVESDYTVILFVGGMIYQPGISWLIKAYYGLDRNPKFGKKLFYYDAISELAKAVPIKQINIPEAILEYNNTVDKAGEKEQVKGTSPGTGIIFGKDVSALVQSTNELLPGIADLLEYIENQGYIVEGIFRRSPSSVELQKVKASLDAGGRIEKESIDPHIVAVLLKMILRELTSPIIPESLHASLDDLDSSKEESTSVAIIKSMVTALPSPNYILLAKYFKALKKVADNQDKNLMSPNNLAIVFAPNILRGSSPLSDYQRMNSSNMAVKIMVSHYDEIFDKE